MKLCELFENVNNNLPISGLAFDTKNLKKGYVFFCLSGTARDGRDFAFMAEEKGAACLVVEKEVPGIHIPQILVKNARAALCEAASKFYGEPSKKLKFVGITGTNGKTTTCFIIKKILEQAGEKVGLFGTNGTYIGGRRYKSDLTTPDPIYFHEMLAKMVKQNVSYVVMEVSAHALALDKLQGITFEVGAISNITQDHLDFFKTMENYQNTKLSFFNQVKTAVVNIDDERCKQGISKINVPIVTYGLYSPAECFAVDIVKKLSGSNFVLNILDNVYIASTRLVGEFNIYNALCASTVCALLGVSGKNIISGLKKINPPLGRFNVVHLSEDISAVVDFAHTPDGIEKVLKTIKEVSIGKVVCVFGCGGNRDKTKRPLMGKLAEELADFVVLTSDNPRYEEPMDIIHDIEGGMMKENHVIVENREEAIRKAIEIASDGGVIAVLGKGAESYQETMGEKKPYSDFTALEEAYE